MKNQLWKKKIIRRNEIKKIYIIKKKKLKKSQMWKKTIIKGIKEENQYGRSKYERKKPIVEEENAKEMNEVKSNMEDENF